VTFAKVLSLAASDNEAEPARAMQIAKRMLEAAGLDFVDVANLIVEPAACAESEAIETLRDKLAQLRRESRQLKSENRHLRSGSSARKPEDIQIARLRAEVRRLLKTDFGPPLPSRQALRGVLRMRLMSGTSCKEEVAVRRARHPRTAGRHRCPVCGWPVRTCLPDPSRTADRHRRGR